MFDKIIKTTKLPFRFARIEKGRIVIERAELNIYESGHQSVGSSISYARPFGRKRISETQASRAVERLNFLYREILPRRKKVRTKLYR